VVAIPRLLVGRETEVAEAYRSGASVSQLAATYGVSAATICRALDRAGEPRRRAGRSDAGVIGREQEIAAAYRAGATIQQLADEYGCSVKPIRDALDRAGVQRRPSGQARLAVGLERQILEEYRAGATLLALAARYGVGTKVIARVLEDQGQSRRPPGRRRKS
jgi:uncharacterized protein (DUF433 family)